MLPVLAVVAVFIYGRPALEEAASEIGRHQETRTVGVDYQEPSVVKAQPMTRVMFSTYLIGAPMCAQFTTNTLHLWMHLPEIKSFVL